MRVARGRSARAYPAGVGTGSPSIRRRAFLIGSLGSVALAAGCTRGPSDPGAPTASTPPRPESATPTASTATDLAVAVIGAGGHGTKLARRFARHRRARLTMVCDPDSARADALADEVRDIAGTRPRTFTDLRRVLDDPSVDAVVVATPHHWHALAAVWALEAGKHVYLEKPATHSLREGPALLEAWRRTGLVVEVGTQRRSHPGLQEAIAQVHAGEIGQVDLARCFSWKRRAPIGTQVRGTWPATLSADLWFGPRPVTRPTRQKFHYDWHWFTEFGNGGLGNNGVHRLDVARWGLGLDGIGSQVLSLGGRLGPADAGQTPNTALTVVAFGERAVAHDLRGLPTDVLPGMDRSDEVVFVGESASIVVSRTGGRLVDDRGRTVRTYGADAADVDPITRHIRGFVAAVLAGDPGKVAVGPAEGVGAAAMCHSAAAAHADAQLRGGLADTDEALEATYDLCGPAMDGPAEAFVEHALGHGGRRGLSFSGVRSISGTQVEGAVEDFDYRPGFELHV